MTSIPGSSGPSHTDTTRSCDLSRYISSPLPQIFLLSTLLAGSVVPLPQAHAQTPPGATATRDLGPTVTILSPQYSDLLKGKTQVLIAVKTQHYAPEFVEMFVDDRPVTYDAVNKTSKIRLEAVPSAAFDWVTTRFTDGPHRLKVRITDTQGFIGEADVTVYINNGTERDTAAPVLEWLNIQSGQVLNGKVNVQLQALDNFGVKYVIVSLNPTDTPDRKPPAWAWFFNRPPYTVALDTLKMPDGTYVMKGTAYDVLENEGYSAPLYFGISNNAINPTTIQQRLRAITGAPKAVPAEDAQVAAVPTPAPATASAADSVTDATSTTDATAETNATTATDTTTVANSTSAPELPRYSAWPGRQDNVSASHSVALPATSMLSDSERKGAAKMESALTAKSGYSRLHPERHPNASHPPRYARLSPPAGVDLNIPLHAATPKVFTAPALSVSGAARIAAGSSATRASVPPASRQIPAQNPGATIAPWNPGKSVPSVAATSGAGKTPAASRQATTPLTSRPPAVGTGTLVAARPKPPVQHGVANIINPSATLQQRSKQGAITEVPVVLRSSDAVRLVSLRLSSPSESIRPVREVPHTPPATSKVTEVTVLPTGGQSAITGGANRSRQAQSERTPVLRPSLPRMAFSPNLNTGRGANTTANSITVAPLRAGSTPGALPATYVAQRNESLEAIAKRFKLPVGVLAVNNNLKANARVTRGTRVKLPQTLLLSYEGKPVTGDVAPILIDSTGVAAFRFLFEKQGGVMTWDAEQQQVKARNNSHEVTLTIGSKTAVVNQQEVMMDLAAFLLSGRTMVPIRFFEKALHAHVDWEPSTGRIYVAMTN